MTDVSKRILQDVAKTKAGLGIVANAYTNAAAARLEKALDDLNAAFMAKNRADFDAAQADARKVIGALRDNKPIEAPATEADPSPAPVPSPVSESAIESALTPEFDAYRRADATG